MRHSRARRRPVTHAQLRKNAQSFFARCFFAAESQSFVFYRGVKKGTEIFSDCRRVTYLRSGLLSFYLCLVLEAVRIFIGIPRVAVASGLLEHLSSGDELNAPRASAALVDICRS